MILWFDKDFEPQTTKDTAWATNANEAINGVIYGMPLDYIDTDDCEEAVKFFEWLKEQNMLKYVGKVNIHGMNINQTYKKKICEICNSENIIVSLNAPNIFSLKKADIVFKGDQDILWET